jgi:hypothetical protein
MRKTRRKVRGVSDVNTFHDLYVLFLANRDREVEFVKNSPGAYTSVCFHGSGDRVSSASRDYLIKLNGKRHTSIKGGVGFHKLAHGCLTNVDRRMHYFVNVIHNLMRLEFTWVGLEVISRGVICHAC